MIGLLCLALAVLASPFKSKLRLEAENAVLRHQLNVVRRRLPGRVRLTNNDRWFFIQLYRWFPSILQVLTIIRPETLVRCTGLTARARCAEIINRRTSLCSCPTVAGTRRSIFALRVAKAIAVWLLRSASVARVRSLSWKMARLFLPTSFIVQADVPTRTAPTAAITVVSNRTAYFPDRRKSVLNHRFPTR